MRRIERYQQQYGVFIAWFFILFYFILFIDFLKNFLFFFVFFCFFCLWEAKNSDIHVTFDYLINNVIRQLTVMYYVTTGYSLITAILVP